MNIETRFSNNFSIEGLGYRTAAPISIKVLNGRIVDIQAVHSVEAPLWIGPGLIDLQVNGFCGRD